VGGELIYAGARDVTAQVLAEEEELEAMRKRLERIKGALEGRDFSMMFQPIVDFRNREVVGLEALARFKARPHRPPDVWFEEADSVGLLSELELFAVTHAARYAHRVPAGTFMSVNVSPQTLVAPGFPLAIEGVDGEQLVVEVTEHAMVEDYNQLSRAIAELRGKGVRLAIDDAGAGFASLRHIVHLVPEFIKLDLSLTRHIDADPVKRALAAAMVTFANEIGSRLIAEGVETAGELKALENLGFAEAQGFYLSKPRRYPTEKSAA
jgi:EAL domain-containing protein (putative c-di-GMP-specific phosphodiesterase class I)